MRVAERNQSVGMNRKNKKITPAGHNVKHCLLCSEVLADRCIVVEHSAQFEMHPVPLTANV